MIVVPVIMAAAYFVWRNSAATLSALAHAGGKMNPERYKPVKDLPLYLRQIVEIVKEKNDRIFELQAKVASAGRIDAMTGLLSLPALKSDMLPYFNGKAGIGSVALIIFEINVSNDNEAITPALTRVIVQSLNNALNEVYSQQDQNDELFKLASIHPNTFGIFLYDCSASADVDRVLRSLDREFSHPKTHEKGLILFDTNAGVAMAPIHAAYVDGLIDAALLALYRCKLQTGTTFVWYTTHMRREAMARTTLENKIRHGVKHDEFFPVFQPKISFETGQIMGVEALARWDRPDGEFISPVTFVPAAERLDLIGQIGNVIMKKSCIAAAKWQAEGHDISVAVNVSPQQLLDEGFSTFVLETLLSTGLSPKRLEIEITESMAVENPDRVIEVMAPLREMGVKLAIDDFGTGHSNLSTLARIPFDVFKIDRAFIKNVTQSPQRAAICEMLLNLAQTLGQSTVAEGIETEEEAAFLRKHGADLAQGWLYSRGLPFDKFLHFAEDWDETRMAS